MILPQDYNNLSQPQRREVRLEYVKIQENICSHCGEPLDQKPSKEVQEKKLDLRLFPKGFLRWPTHLHHDHDTGMTIGAIHARCNGVLWQYYGE